MPLQLLPENVRPMLRCIETFGGDAKMVDSVGWMAAASEKGKKVLPGSEADVFDWLEWKLRAGLPQWKSKSGKNMTASWKWRQEGTVMRVLVWCTGSRESEQSEPLHMDDISRRSVSQWWPCIVLVPHGEDPEVLAFYCPALAWAFGRPWMVHRSRCFVVPADYRIILRSLAAGVATPNSAASSSTTRGRWRGGRRVSSEPDSETGPIVSDCASSASSGSAAWHWGPSVGSTSSSSGMGGPFSTASAVSSADISVTNLSTASQGFVTVNGVTFLAVTSPEPGVDDVWSYAEESV